MRYRSPPPADLDDAQRHFYEMVVNGSRGNWPGLTEADGRLRGPFRALIANPAVGEAVQSLGLVFREGELPARARELVILTVAATLDSHFEWASHEPVA